MELNPLAKAVAMYNMLYPNEPLIEGQAKHFLNIWDMINARSDEAPKEEKIVDSDIIIPPAKVELPPPLAPVEEKESFAVMLSEAAEGDFIPASGEVPTKTHSNVWVPGKNFRIAVTPRREHPNLARYNLYFAEKPSQEAFDAEFVHFQNRTHNVHVHHRVWKSDWDNWTVLTITDEYCSWRHKNAGCMGETREPGDGWHEPEARFRIKFKTVSQVAHADFKYIYFHNNPGYELMQEYDRRYTFVVLEMRDNVIKATQLN